MIASKPGDTITPASFAVAPELLGRPLARPGQRAAAMAIDLVLVGILANGSGVFFGLAAAFALWRASARSSLSARRPRLRRLLRLGTAFVLFLLVVGNWRVVTRPFQRLASDGGGSGDDEEASALVTDSSRNVKLSANLGDLAAVGDFMALRKATDPKEARHSADRLVSRMKKKGMSPQDLRQVESALTQEGDSGKAAMPPAALAALHDAIAAMEPSAPGDEAARAPDRDSLARAYVQALARADTSALEELRPRLGSAFAADSLEQLRGELRGLSERNQKLREKVRADSVQQASRPAGLLANAADVGGEVARLLKKAGLGFGWLGLYFTGFVAMMKGQTPGKWLLRIRIVRLDGRPMGWWAALERFGGYAASVVTALSGFFQILWDKNRQAMHDKIAETVVVRI